MAMAAAPNGSSSILSAPVTYKKCHGTLMLFEDRFLFTTHPTQPNLEVNWSRVKKHQVSPATHPKHLLQILLHDENTNIPHLNKPQKPGSKSSYKFEFTSREILNQFRSQVSMLLMHHQQRRGVKRPNSSMSNFNGMTNKNKNSKDSTNDDADDPKSSTSFCKLSPTTSSVTRASILSSNQSLRKQHELLVPDTLSENDFWDAHQALLANEAAKIHGKYRTGMPSEMNSNLDLTNFWKPSGLKGGKKKITLGVEEMRQIFIMYPAVHRAYEEKVPLDWSEEQFWRKYLESEFFHRDRGRVGSALNRMARRLGSGSLSSAQIEQEDQKQAKKEEEEENAKLSHNDKSQPNDQDQGDTSQQDESQGTDARVSGTDDIFSRYDGEMMSQKQLLHWKSRPAIGQFDLTSTYFTERSHVGLPDNNKYPVSSDGTGTLGIESQSLTANERIIQKYNRHWAMVLNPEEATAKSNLLTDVAQLSTEHVLPNDEIPKALGGNHTEMVRLVQFANCEESGADHARGRDAQGEGFVELKLKNVEAYSGKIINDSEHTSEKDPSSTGIDREVLISSELAQSMAQKMRAKQIELEGQQSSSENRKTIPQIDQKAIFAVPKRGKLLLERLSAFMAQDMSHKDEAASVTKVTSSLPQDFKIKLISFFRRSSELLRHFYLIRQSLMLDSHEEQQHNHQQSSFTSVVMPNSVSQQSRNTGNKSNSDEHQKKKLRKIVSSMEQFYREMEETRKSLPMTEQGELMGKMCMPIMDQLDYAMRVHRRSGGGFATIES